MNLPIFQVKLPVHGEVLKLGSRLVYSVVPDSAGFVPDNSIEISEQEKRNNTNE